MSTNVYVLHGVQLPGDYIGQIEDASPVTGIEDVAAYNAGHVSPLWSTVFGANGEVSFSTTQLASLFGQIGQFGADFSGGNTDLFYRQAVNRGTRLAVDSSSNYRLRMASNAFGLWNSISASQGVSASASTRIIPTVSDGSTAPIVAAAAATSGTPDASEHFTLGPLSLNSTAVDLLTGWTLNLQAEVEIIRVQGYLFPVHVHVRSIRPVFEINGLDIPAIFGHGFTGATLTGLTAYLRRKSKTGNVANGTTSHISIAASAGQILPVQASGGGNGSAGGSLRVTIDAADASSNPLTISTGVAIS